MEVAKHSSVLLRILYYLLQNFHKVLRGSTCHTWNSTFRTSLFALHTSNPTWPYTSSHLIWVFLTSSHLISPHLSILFSSQMSSKFFSTIFVSPEHCSTFRISSKLFLTHLSASVCQQVSSVREKLFYTKTVARRKLFHGGASGFRTRMRLRTKAFTRGNFTHRKLFHWEPFTQRLLQTETFSQRNFLHTDPFTHRRFYTTAFTHDTFTHRGFYTQTLLHRRKRYDWPSRTGFFSSVLDVQRPFRA